MRRIALCGLYTRWPGCERGFVGVFVQVGNMSAGASAGAQEAYERIHQEYETNRQAHTELVHKVEKMTGDLNEHEMVIRALEAVPKGRRCFNLVGGVLVERTVDEVIPSLKNNVQGVRCACARYDVASFSQRQRLLVLCRSTKLWLP
mgnify:CR=1 FL=1